MARVNQFERTQLPDVIQPPQLEFRVRMQKQDMSPFDEANKNMDSARNVVGDVNPYFVKGAETAIANSMTTIKLLAGIAEKRQEEIDSIELAKIKAGAQVEFNRVLVEAQQSQPYENLPQYVNDAMSKYYETTSKGLTNPRLTKKVNGMFELSAITNQVEIQDAFLKKQVDFQEAEFNSTLETLVNQGDKMGIANLVNSQAWMNEVSKQKLIDKTTNGVDFLNAQKDIDRMGNKWLSTMTEEERQKIYPDLDSEQRRQLEIYTDAAQNRIWQDNFNEIMFNNNKKQYTSNEQLITYMENGDLSPALAARAIEWNESRIDRIVSRNEAYARKQSAAQEKNWKAFLKTKDIYTREAYELAADSSGRITPDTAMENFEGFIDGVRAGNYVSQEDFEDDLRDTIIAGDLPGGGQMESEIRREFTTYNKNRDSQWQIDYEMFGKDLSQTLSDMGLTSAQKSNYLKEYRRSIDSNANAEGIQATMNAIVLRAFERENISTGGIFNSNADIYSTAKTAEALVIQQLISGRLDASEAAAQVVADNVLNKGGKATEEQKAEADERERQRQEQEEKEYQERLLRAAMMSAN